MAVRVTFVTEIPTPYMNAVFSALSRRCQLTVLFSAASATRAMEWDLGHRFPFPHRFVGGRVLPRSVDESDRYPSPRVLAALVRSRPDAVISGGFSFPSLYAAAYARLTGVPLILHSDGTGSSEAGMSRAQVAARRLLARTSAAAAGNSRAAVARFVELGWSPDRVFLAPHSTALEALHAVARRRTEQRRDARWITVLTVGRLIRRKGVDRLIAATARARATGADVRLRIVGTGAEEDVLRAQAAALDVPVEWRGFIDQSELPHEYAAADAFALPSLDDPFGMVLLEAAAAGLPLVGSIRAGATTDLVVDGRTGFAVDPSDSEAFSRVLVALGDPELRHRLGWAAHVSTLERTPGATADGYLRAVGAALGGR